MPRLKAILSIGFVLLIHADALALLQDRTSRVGVDAVRITVDDLDRSISFFSDVLTFEADGEVQSLHGEAFSREQGLEHATARLARLRLGDERVDLIDFATPAGRPFPPDARSNDRWFQHIAIIVSDMDRAYARLLEHGVRPASRGGPQRLPDWNPNAGGIRAFYFRDPDGHFLEILQFPPGKGDPRWHSPADPDGSVGPASPPIFLGVDHTAIVVADTDASLKFYRDLLGFVVVGGGENYGPEQENLNNVEGARLRITTLRGAGGPAIEFLEYLGPRDGRPYPPDATLADVLSWQVTLIADAPDGLLGATRVSLDRRAPGSGDASPAPPGSAIVVRDPDGHALRIAGSRTPR